MQKILRLQPVIARIGISRSNLYAKVGRNEFPAPIKLGARAVGWIEQEIDDWISNQIEQSRKSNNS